MVLFTIPVLVLFSLVDEDGGNDEDDAKMFDVETISLEIHASFI